MSNPAVVRRVLWNQLQELVKDYERPVVLRESKRGTTVRWHHTAAVQSRTLHTGPRGTRASQKANGAQPAGRKRARGGRLALPGRVTAAAAVRAPRRARAGHARCAPIEMRTDRDARRCTPMRTPRMVAQVTHSLSAYSGLELYSNLTASEIDTMWERVPGQREIARTHGLG